MSAPQADGGAEWPCPALSPVTPDCGCTRACPFLLAIQAGDQSAREQLNDRWTRDLVALARYFAGELKRVKEPVLGVLRGLREDRLAWQLQTTLRAHICRETRTAALQAAAPGVSIRGNPADLPGASDLGRGAAIVAGLPERLRTTWLLHYFSGMSPRELAYVMGISDAEVSACISLTRRAIEAELPGFFD